MQNNQSNQTQVATTSKTVASIKNFFGKADNIERINGIFGNDQKMISRFKDSLIVQISKNPKLAQCTVTSIVQCAFDIALSGMIPDGRNAHLVPFKDTCTVIVDYKGYVRQILNNPDYLDVKGIIVYANEEFEMNCGDVVVHKQIIDPNKRGEAIGCYTMVKHVTGQRSFEFMNREEIEAIRDNSMGYTMSKKYNKESIWDTNSLEMWKKTVIRRHQKTLKLDVDAQHLFQIPDVNLYRDGSGKTNSNYGKKEEDEGSITFDAPEPEQIEEKSE